MKNKYSTLCYQFKQLLNTTLCCTALGMSSASLASTHSLLIAVDGLRGDGIENANTPHLDTLINGTWAAGYKAAFAHYAQTMTDARQTVAREPKGSGLAFAFLKPEFKPEFNMQVHHYKLSSEKTSSGV